MKSIYTIRFCILFLFVFQHFVYGQIKTDDGSYSSNLNNLKKEERIVQSLPSYSSLFEPNARSVAWLNLVENDELADGLRAYESYSMYGQQAVNPVGEQVFIDSDDCTKRLCLNTNTAKAMVRRIPKGYYTIVGYIGRFVYCYLDEAGKTKINKQRYLEMIKNQIELLEQYSFENEDERYWAYELIIEDNISSEYRTDIKKLADWYRNDLARFGNLDAKLENRYLRGLLRGKIIARENYRSSIFIIEDQEGNRYYDFSGNLVSVTCYDRIKELIMNKQVIVTDMQEKDYLTGEKLNSEIACQHGVEFYCKDIFLHDGVLVGVFSKDNGEITLRLTGYTCTDWRFEEIGEKGIVTIGGYSCTNRGYYDYIASVYPKCYIEQCDSIRNLEAQKRKDLEISRQQNVEMAKIQHRKDIIAKYGEKWGDLILDRKVAIGMTKDMCRASVGYPTNIFTKTTSMGKSEVWSYSSNYATMWLYFYDGIIYEIDEIR